MQWQKPFEHTNMKPRGECFSRENSLALVLERPSAALAREQISSTFAVRLIATKRKAARFVTALCCLPLDAACQKATQPIFRLIAHGQSARKVRNRQRQIRTQVDCFIVAYKYNCTVCGVCVCVSEWSVHCVGRSEGESGAGCGHGRTNISASTANGRARDYVSEVDAETSRTVFWADAAEAASVLRHRTFVEHFCRAQKAGNSSAY